MQFDLFNFFTGEQDRSPFAICSSFDFDAVGGANFIPHVGNWFAQGIPDNEVLIVGLVNQFEARNLSEIPEALNIALAAVAAAMPAGLDT